MLHQISRAYEGQSTEDILCSSAHSSFMQQAELFAKLFLYKTGQEHAQRKIKSRGGDDCRSQKDAK